MMVRPSHEQKLADPLDMLFQTSAHDISLLVHFVSSTIIAAVKKRSHSLTMATSTMHNMKCVIYLVAFFEQRR